MVKAKLQDFPSSNKLTDFHPPYVFLTVKRPPLLIPTYRYTETDRVETEPHSQEPSFAQGFPTFYHFLFCCVTLFPLLRFIKADPENGTKFNSVVFF